MSKIFLNKYGISSKVVPDLIFYKKTTDSIFKKNNNILITDLQLIEIQKNYLIYIINLKTMQSLFHFFLSYNERSKLITKLKFIVYRIVNTFFPKKLNVFSIFTLTNYQSLIRLLLSSNYLISGRFHMIALSLIYKVPFNYTSSNTYKIEGLLKDIGISGENKFSIKI